MPYDLKKNFTIPMVVYPFDLMVSFAESDDRLRRMPDTPVEFGYLQHEIFHYVTFLLDRLGITFCLETSDEAFAYLVGYITTEIYKKIDKIVF